MSEPRWKRFLRNIGFGSLLGEAPAAPPASKPISKNTPGKVDVVDDDVPSTIEIIIPRSEPAPAGKSTNADRYQAALRKLDVGSVLHDALQAVTGGPPTSLRVMLLLPCCESILKLKFAEGAMAISPRCVLVAAYRSVLQFLISLHANSCPTRLICIAANGETTPKEAYEEGNDPSARPETAFQLNHYHLVNMSRADGLLRVAVYSEAIMQVFRSLEFINTMYLFENEPLLLLALVLGKKGAAAAKEAWKLRNGPPDAKLLILSVHEDLSLEVQSG